MNKRYNKIYTNKYFINRLEKITRTQIIRTQKQITDYKKDYHLAPDMFKANINNVISELNKWVNEYVEIRKYILKELKNENKV